jgi:hypothetical protein
MAQEEGGTAAREEVVLSRPRQRRKSPGWAAWFKRPNRLVGGWAKIGWENLFGIKIGFLNLLRL